MSEGTVKVIVDKEDLVSMANTVRTITKTSGEMTMNQLVNANTNIPSMLDVMTGVTESVDGASGLVPAPAAGDESKVLFGNGAWGDLPAGGGGWTTVFEHTLEEEVNNVQSNRFSQIENNSIITTATEMAISCVMPLHSSQENMGNFQFTIFDASGGYAAQNYYGIAAGINNCTASATRTGYFFSHLTKVGSANAVVGVNLRTNNTGITRQTDGFEYCWSSVQPDSPRLVYRFYTHTSFPVGTVFKVEFR